jgi:hypothetical protein
LGNTSKIVKFYTDYEFGLRFRIFQLLGIVVNQTNYVKLQIGIIINGLNSTRIFYCSHLNCIRDLTALVLRTRSVKSLVQSKFVH